MKQAKEHGYNEDLPEVLCYCKNCEEEVEPLLESKTFSNGTVHIGASCPHCYRFIKWLPQTEAKDVVLYFGKYKGKKLNEIPKEYLEWLLTTNIKSRLRLAIIELLTLL